MITSRPIVIWSRPIYIRPQQITIRLRPTFSYIVTNVLGNDWPEKRHDTFDIVSRFIYRDVILYNCIATFFQLGRDQLSVMWFI